MKDSSLNAVTDGMSFTSFSDYYKSVSDTWMNMYCNPARAYTNPFITTSNGSTTSSSLAWSPQLETNSNELKINVKKRYIKFNFNL